MKKRNHTQSPRMCTLLVVIYLKSLYTSVQEGMIAFEGIFKDIHKNAL